MRNKVIKKMISMLLVIVMLCSLTGCSGSGDSADSADSGNPGDLITGTWYLVEMDTGNGTYNKGELAEIFGAA